jgi:HAD domain in Swiss Army Knife RNA repair proteins
MSRPLLLIDVDGVISLFGADHPRHGEVVTTLVDGIPHLLSRRAAAALNELADAFEPVWCTGWEERADEHLPALLGLPRGWPHIRFPDRPEFAAHWKLSGIDAYAGARALAWVDDAHDPACRDWARNRSAPTLLVSTKPGTGLTDEHAAQLRRWAAQLR